MTTDATSALRGALWQCFIHAGGDTDGASGPDGYDDATLIRRVVAAVRDLRECYDEALAADAADGVRLQAVIREGVWAATEDGRRVQIWRVTQDQGCWCSDLKYHCASKLYAIEAATPPTGGEHE